MNKIVLSDPTRRALRTTYQAFVGLVGAMPVIVIGLQQMGADIFGTDSKLYGRVLILGGVATVVTGAVARFILFLEQHNYIPEWIKKQNTEPTVVAVEVSKDGVVQDAVLVQEDSDSDIVSDQPEFMDDEPGRHSVDRDTNG